MESRCSACGREIPPESRFCLFCGSQVEGTPAKTSPARMILRPWWLPAALGAVCIAAVLAVALIGGRHKVAREPVGPAPVPQVVSPVMPGEAQQPEQPPSGAPPVQMPSTAGAAPAPAVVPDYLAKVQRIEEYRRSLYTELKQVEERVRAVQPPGGGMPDAFKKQLSAACNSFTRRSKQLGDYYKTVRPPSGFEEFATAYDKALARSLWSMQRSYLEVERGGLAAAGAVRSAYQPEVDDELKASDKALDDACRAAGVAKSLSILPDEGAGKE